MALPGASVALKLAEVIDFGKERERLDREMAQIDARISGIDNKLGNERFLIPRPGRGGRRPERAAQRTRRANAQRWKARSPGFGSRQDYATRVRNDLLFSNVEKSHREGLTWGKV